jgi:SAM-dependent methyltransferase
MSQIPEECFALAAADWLTRLDSRDGYCGRLQGFHAAPLREFHPETGVSIWSLRNGSGEQLERSIPIPGARWVHFVEAPKPGGANVRDSALLMNAARSHVDVPGLHAIREHVDAPWPDLILVEIPLDHGSDADAELIRQRVMLLYHLLEPGGMIVVALQNQSEKARQVIASLSVSREFDQSYSEGPTVVFKKETSIYTAATIKVTNRSSIFDPVTCERGVTALFKQIDTKPGDRLLDVGVGDGRFSRHFLREITAHGGEYFGIEMTSKPEIHPKFPEVAARTRFDTNFFCLDETEQYDFIVLFFVFHSVKHWPLFFDQARRLLKPGGRVLFANRDDRIIRWTHGRFFGSESDDPSVIRRETMRYWDTRQECGVRSFDQTTTIIDRERCVDAATAMGLRYEKVVFVECDRQYCLDRRHLSPGEDDPAMWNIGRVGLTRSDRRKLSQTFRVDSVEEALSENLYVSVMSKGF